MITLITGTPGAGKTAYAVMMLQLELQKSPRPVFVVGIPDLKLPHERAPKVEEWTLLESSEEDETEKEAAFTFPDGALVIIDEAQKLYRPRPVGGKVPPHVAAFEKHRHKGLDFWLITQHPTLIDSNVRKLVGKHIHLRSQWSGRTLYEWPEANDPESRTNRDAATKRGYRLPSKIFGLYKSASIHVKQSRRIPVALYVLIAAILVSGGGIYYSMARIGAAVDPVLQKTGPDAERGSAAFTPRAQPAAPDRLPQNDVSPDAWVPRINTRPETAPLYDSFRQVKTMPVVAGCLAMRDRCKCYTDQATDAFLTEDQCREWMKNPPFNPWREDRPSPKEDVVADSASTDT